MVVFVLSVVASENGFLWCARKEFQRAHLWEKFKHNGKLYWVEGK